MAQDAGPDAGRYYCRTDQGNATGRYYHPSYNLAKLPFEPSIVIAREAIRSRYGDGLAGAPLKLNRLPDDGRTTDRDADGAAHAGSTGTHGPGPVRSDPAE